jgi:co-chaperonin GroES (HSP10)
MSGWTVPDLKDCDAGIEPTEYNVLIAMATKPEKSAGGVIFTEETRDREQWGAEHGRILGVSPLAFNYAAWPNPSDRPAVGDVVFVGRYPGKQAVGRDGKTYHLVSDREIAGIIERAQPQTMEAQRAA